MDSQVFGAGNLPGSPSTPIEVKTLLCYLMAEISHSFTFEQLHATLLDERLVNYFELVQNLEQLVLSGHIALKKQAGLDTYTLKALGEKTARELSSSLSKSVRERAVSSARITIAREKRRRETPTAIEKRVDGYRLTLRIPDSGTDLLELALFLPTEQACLQIQRRFLNDPTFLYKAMIALLSGDKTLLGELIPGETELF